MTDEDGIDTILDWPTLTEETKLLSDQMAAFLRSNPIAYAGHRIMANFAQVDKYDGATENDEVPFLNWWFFSIALSGYWLFRRLLHVVGFSTAPSEFDGHLLVMNSDRNDKRYALSAVGEQLIDEGHDVLLLCSPEAESYREGWEEQGFTTMSFIELLGGIPLAGWVSVISTTIRSVRGLRDHAPEEFAAAPRTIFNFVFLEAVKAEACIQMSDHPTIHTYSPMGYVLAATEFDQIFSYQHGIMYGQQSDTGDQEYRRGYPFFAPINYFTWGEAWHDKFRYSTPPETQLHPTGTPWHEFLAQYDADDEEEYDVLFLSSAGRQTADGEEAFEEFVERLIDICGRRDWRLRIKLHPKENGDWYADRDWSEYVLAADTALQNALSNTKVGVTSGSSTLIDSVILGTPYCVWYDQQSPLEQQDPDLVFDITPKTIETTIEEAMEMAADDSGPPSVLNCYGVTDRIVEISTASDS
jgi:hypothetical protein